MQSGTIGLGRLGANMKSRLSPELEIVAGYVTGGRSFERETEMGA